MEDFDIIEGSVEEQAEIEAEKLSAETAEEEVEPQKTIEERVTNAKAFMYAQPMNRELYYKLLQYCKERRVLHEIEEFIQEQPEYAGTNQSPYFIIDDLYLKEILDMYELDEAGNVVTEERKEGLTPNEIDDLVCDFAFEDSEVGKLCAEDLSVLNRYKALVGDNMGNVQMCQAVMEYVTEKRSPVAITEMLIGRDFAEEATLSPSVLIDKLEKAGVIVWQKGWLLSEEGKELLQKKE